MCVCAANLFVCAVSEICERANKRSAQREHWSGISQGSTLGPLFFVIYVNNLFLDRKCELRMYADDVTNDNNCSGDAGLK